MTRAVRPRKTKVNNESYAIDGLLFFQVLVSSIWFRDGAVAQLGERMVCNHEVVGSNPIGSI